MLIQTCKNYEQPARTTQNSDFQISDFQNDKTTQKSKSTSKIDSKKIFSRQKRNFFYLNIHGAK